MTSFKVEEFSAIIFISTFLLLLYYLLIIVSKLNIYNQVTI